MQVKLRWIEFFLLLVIAMSTIVVVTSIRSIEKTHQIEADNLTSTLGAELQLVIDEQFILMDSVESFTRINYASHEFGDDFNKFVEPLYDKRSFIKNISVAPGGVQRYVYPLEGNEMVIGHNLINDQRENVRNDVKRTIETREPAVSGPYELRQGGIGLIARKSIYIDDELWGIIAMVADFERSVDYTNLDTLGTNMAIELVNSSGDSIWMKNDRVGEPLSTFEIKLPEGNIMMYVSETDESLREIRFRQVQWIFVYLLLFTLSGIVYSQHRKQLLGLESELEKRNMEIKMLNNELEQSKMVAIGSLVKGLCHEVNTPLGNSLTLATYIRNEVYSHQNETQNDVGDAIDATIHGIRKSIGIIDKLKDLSEIQSTQNISEFKVKEYLEFAVINMSKVEMGIDANFKISCPESLTVISNPSAIYQIMTLLIENSIEHGFKERGSGTIRIDVTSSDGRLTIIYKDDGAGIEEKDLPNVFEPYYTRDMANFRGMGLYTVFTIVNQQLEGHIRVNSIVGNGTEYYIELPMSIYGAV